MPTGSSETASYGQMHDSRLLAHAFSIDALSTVSHIRLDGEGICEIDNLEMFADSITHLYLQRVEPLSSMLKPQNLISKIENLDFFPKLQFLVLSRNSIAQVEGIASIASLRFVDLSNNQITAFTPSQFPKSLIFLEIKGNPATLSQVEKLEFARCIPSLKAIDGESILESDEAEEVSEEGESADYDPSQTEEISFYEKHDGIVDKSLFYTRRDIEQAFHVVRTVCTVHFHGGPALI
jgi:Leucine-rich repeat (LRR) protein